MELEQHVRARCAAAGLDPDEMERLLVESGSISRVLARIGGAEVDACRPIERGDTPAGRPVGVGTRRWRATPGSSATLSLRLDHDEMAELRGRAERQGVGVSVLARAYLRRALAAPPDARPW
ncbi:Ribbon-helix-helix protein, copG family [Jatrophihabitans endophyticus]|uniref:Ribbon-helix-helix protein, copG family n=1 Tax=Jatrophihabitans endophyticus TaxID=1206085 RepID=A0A1M5LIC9_9ACTN|nr:ribbon-helix-helix protein, CopG family [Jatrophihabitans endophyticus]SHG64716.1 Ribbon-helix-helix protein, copG family [Jatrophihabitans endophyticus]